MAVEKFLYLDQTGLQTVSNYLLRAANTRIKERITTWVSGGPAAASYSDDTHVLSAKAILGLIGNIGNYATITANDGTILGKVKDLDVRIGTSSDTTTDSTVYGEIARVRAEISQLTHLTYEVVHGPISSVQNPAEDKLYLQNDLDAPKVGLDGFLRTNGGEMASVGTGDATYYGYYDADENKYYKATYDSASGQYVVTETELVYVPGASSGNDPIFAVAGTVSDGTYTLWVWNNIGGDPVQHEWLAVGDTAIDLQNYWSKTDADVNALKNLIVGAIPTGDETTAGTVIYAVKQAFDATDPYTGGSSAYVDGWLA